MTTLWTMDEAVQKLRDFVKLGKAKNFSLMKERIERIEKYYSAPLVLDQDRHVSEDSVYLKMTVPRGATQGLALLLIHTDRPLVSEIERVLAAAEVSSEESWDLPFPEGSVVVDESGLDPQIGESLSQTAQQMASQLEEAVLLQKNGEFNSAELFLSKKSSELYLSTGFCLKKKSSRIYTEICYSAGDTDNSQEYLLTQMGVSAQEFDFQKLARESAELALASVRADKTPSGKFDVIIDQETLGMILATSLQHLSAENMYHNLPFRKMGDDFVRSYVGTPFRLTMDGTRPLGMSSNLFTRDGLREKPLVLVESNRVANALISQQHSQYLKLPTTADQGNLILECQGLPRETLVSSKPFVVEVLQFSAFSVNPMDLTFSSEIRLARIYDNDKKRQFYVRGGNLSGRFDENFKHVQFSNEWGLKNLNTLSFGEGRGRGFWGPQFALLNDVVISS